MPARRTIVAQIKTAEGWEVSSLTSEDGIHWFTTAGEPIPANNIRPLDPCAGVGFFLFAAAFIIAAAFVAFVSQPKPKPTVNYTEVPCDVCGGKGEVVYARDSDEVVKKHMQPGPQTCPGCLGSGMNKVLEGD